MGSGDSSGVLRSSAPSGTNCLAIGSLASLRSISSFIAGVMATAYCAATRSSAARCLSVARPASPRSDSVRKVFGAAFMAVSFAVSLAVVLLSSCDGGPEHVLDLRRAGRQHHQPIEAQRYTGGWWHFFERREEIGVDRIALAVA